MMKIYNPHNLHPVRPLVNGAAANLEDGRAASGRCLLGFLTMQQAGQVDSSHGQGAQGYNLERPAAY